MSRQPVTNFKLPVIVFIKAATFECIVFLSVYKFAYLCFHRFKFTYVCQGSRQQNV